MQLDKLTLENFKGSTSKLEVRFNEMVTFLIGINGSGKSMIGNAIQFLFAGKTFFNPKYRRNMISGDAKRMKVSGEFINKETGKTIIISQSLTTGDTPNLKIETSDGSNLKMAEVLEMINQIYLRPFSIINESPKKQAEMVGVDTNECDLAIKNAKDKLVPLRAEVTRYKKVLENLGDKPEKVEAVNISKLYEEKENITKFNEKQNHNKLMIYTHKTTISDIEIEISNLTIRLEEYKKELATMPPPEPLKSLDEINEKFANTNEITRKANRYNLYTETKELLTNAETIFTTEEKNVIKAQQDKVDYIKSCKVPDKISFDDEGGLTISAFDQENVYLNEDFFSKGQILKLAIQLCLINIKHRQSEGKETIPFIFIDNAESLDKANHEYIQEVSDKHKLQFVLAYQDDKPKSGKSCILLTEKAIKRYKEK